MAYARFDVGTERRIEANFAANGRMNREDWCMLGDGFGAGGRHNVLCSLLFRTAFHQLLDLASSHCIEVDAPRFVKTVTHAHRKADVVQLLLHGTFGIIHVASEVGDQATVGQSGLDAPTPMDVIAHRQAEFNRPMVPCFHLYAARTVRIVLPFVTREGVYIFAIGVGCCEQNALRSVRRAAQSIIRRGETPSRSVGRWLALWRGFAT